MVRSDNPHGGRAEKGQGTTEFVLVIALVVIACIAVYTLFGAQIRVGIATLGFELAGLSTDSSTNTGTPSAQSGRTGSGTGTAQGLGIDGNDFGWNGEINQASIGAGAMTFFSFGGAVEILYWVGWGAAAVEPSFLGEAAMAGITAAARILRPVLVAYNMAEDMDGAMDNPPGSGGDSGSSGNSGGDDGNDSEEKIRNVYNSIKESPKYPKNFEPDKGNTLVNNVRNEDLLQMLRKIEPGKWQKVYKNGWVGNRRVSIHFFRSKSGKVFNVKVVPGWSTRI